MYHPFSVTETISIAWGILKKNFAAIAVYTLLAFIIIAGTGFVLNFILLDIVLKWIGLISTIIIVTFLFLGFIQLTFLLIDKQYYDFEFKDIIPKIKMAFSYIILLIIVSTIYVFVSHGIESINYILVQNLLAVISKFVVEVFFLFYFPICACFIVDDDSGPFEAVAQSFQLIKGNFLKYLLLFIVIEGLVFIGSITVIGIIFVVPFVNILLVVAYHKLVYSHQDVDDDLSETL